MPRWESGWEECTVGADGVLFDALTRTPMDSDWGCPLERFLTDPSYEQHVRTFFAPGTAEEVRAAVFAELEKLGRPIPVGEPPRPRLPPAAPPPPARVVVDGPRPADRPLPLPRGTSDASAFALAQLIGAVARTIDPGFAAVAGPLTWSTADGDPRAQLGSVVVIREHELQDGIGGPVRVFVKFSALALGLPSPARVAADWTGQDALQVSVRGPKACEGAVRALVGSDSLSYEGTGG